MAIANRVIKDIDELTGISQSQDPVVRQILNEHRTNCQAIVTNMYDIYYVAPRKPAQAIAYNEVKRAVRRQGAGEEQAVTESVYKSWIARKEEHSDLLTTKRAANEQVDELLEIAISSKASDIHINIRSETRVHLRIHGLLVESARFSAQEGMAIVAVMFQSYAMTTYGMEEARDGQFYFTSRVTRRSYMVRLNKLLMVGGGITCKCRLRDTADVIDLKTAGYSVTQLDALGEMMGRGQGLMVITGGVNSGKSTSLTALLNSIPSCYSILEISDTVEVKLPHVCHVELPSEGENLERRIAAVQDSTVRQDSDYLAIGEMRNRLTASKAEIMGLQGRFVLSTGHASDAVSFYLRMTSNSDFGMSVNTVLAPRFMVGIISQTLVETLCPDCSSPMPSPDAVARSTFPNTDALLAYYRAGLGQSTDAIRYHRQGGCDNCQATGLSGRTVVAEVLPFDEEVRDLLRSGKFEQIQEVMTRQGMETRHEHGLTKILTGAIDPLHLSRRIDPPGPATIRDWGKHSC